MQQLRWLLLLGTLNGLLGCPRPITGWDDEEIEIGIEGVDLEVYRPAWTGMDAGAVVTQTDGTRVLHVFSGETIYVWGWGWEGWDPELTVDGVALLPSPESSDQELAAIVPFEQVPFGELLIDIDGEEWGTGVYIMHHGLGHLEYWESKGLLDLQISVTAGGASSTTGYGFVTAGGVVGNGGTWGLGNTLSVAFNLGISPDPGQTQYLASLAQGAATELGPIPPWPGGEGSTPIGRRVEITRPFMVAGQTQVRVAALEHAFLDGGVQPGGTANLSHSFRVVTTTGGSPADPNLRGPLFFHTPLTDGTPSYWLLLQLQSGLGFNVLAIPLEDDDGSPGTPRVVTQVLGQAPVAVGLVGNPVFDPTEDWSFSSSKLVVLSCAPPSVANGFETRLHVHAYRLGGLDEPLEDVGHRWVMQEDACTSSLCMSLGAVRELDDGGMTDTPQVETPPVLREIVNDGNHSLVILPSVSDSRRGLGSTPCSMVFTAPLATREELGPLDTDGGATSSDGGADICQQRICYSMVGANDFTRAAAVVQGSPSGLLALGTTDDPMSPAREMLWFRDVEKMSTVGADTITMSRFYTSLFSQPGGLVAYAIRNTGDLLDRLAANAQSVGTQSVLGRPLAAWPMGDSGQVAVVRPNSLMVTDLNGYPDPFRIMPAFAQDAVVLEQPPGEEVHALWGGQQNDAGRPCLVRWNIADGKIDPTPVIEFCVPEISKAVSVEPVFVDERWIVASLLGDGLPGDPCEGAPRFSSEGAELGQGQTSRMVAISRNQSAPRTTWMEVPETCNAHPMALHPYLHRLFVTAPLGNQSMTLRVFRLEEGGAVVESSNQPAHSMLPLPAGGTLGIMVDDLFGTRRLVCMSTDNVPVPLGAAVFGQGVMALSPDGTHIYVGTPGTLLVLELREVEANGCPKAANPDQPSPLRVLTRIPIEGTPSRLVVDQTGTTLVWVDQQGELVGLVE